MALPTGCAASFSLITLLLLSSISIAAGGDAGVAYGRDGDNLMRPPQVVELLKSYGIGAVSIYDTDAEVLRAFAGTGIKVIVALPNEQLAEAAANPDYAATWVRDQVKAYYPATQINVVKVGNEVFHQRPDLTNSLVPAMRNVYNALLNLGLAGDIKLSSPVALSALNDNSFPPSEGSFRDDLQPVLREMLGFLRDTGNYFMVNIYPYIAYRANYPNIPLDYALGRTPNPGVNDPNSGLTYYSLFDAERDAVYYAMDALGFPTAATLDGTVEASSQQQLLESKTSSPESGWDKGGENPGSPGANREMGMMRKASKQMNASLAEDYGANVANAQAYTSIMVKRVLEGRTGTPLHPRADMDLYIFALFDENRKPGPESERHAGLFSPDGKPYFDLPWHPGGGGGGSWCVADSAAGTARMQAALEWACGPGGADCGPIQPGGKCFQPDTVEAHASYAMNDYYQRHNRGAGTCDFQGVGRVVTQNPNFCPGTRDSWCVANPEVGTDRMKAALDWACGQGGADCGPIQPGAPCYEPNTMEAHSSYAMNSYYQKHNRGADTCNFQGVGRIVDQRPKFGNCELPSRG